MTLRKVIFQVVKFVACTAIGVVARVTGETDFAGEIDAEFDPENDFAVDRPKFSNLVLPVRASCCPDHPSRSMWAMTDGGGRLIGYTDSHADAVKLVAHRLATDLREDFLPDELERGAEPQE